MSLKKHISVPALLLLNELSPSEGVGGQHPTFQPACCVSCLRQCPHRQPGVWNIQILTRSQFSLPVSSMIAASCVNVQTAFLLWTFIFTSCDEGFGANNFVAPFRAIGFYSLPRPLSLWLLEGCIEGSRVVSVPSSEDSSPGAVHGAEFLGVPPGGEGRRGLGVAAVDVERWSSRALCATTTCGVIAFLAIPGSPVGSWVLAHNLPPFFLPISPFSSPLISVQPGPGNQPFWGPN